MPFTLTARNVKPKEVSPKTSAARVPKDKMHVVDIEKYRETNPKGSRIISEENAKLLEEDIYQALRKHVFSLGGAALGASALSSDEDTHQDAKGGESAKRKLPVFQGPPDISMFIDPRSLHSYRADAKGGREQMASFLATDDVPDTLFGIPIVSRPEQYTQEDIEFFEDHPDAGGYYDLGDDGDNSHAAEDAGTTTPNVTEDPTLKDQWPPDGFEGWSRAGVYEYYDSMKQPSARPVFPGLPSKVLVDNAAVAETLKLIDADRTRDEQADKYDMKARESLVQRSKKISPSYVKQWNEKYPERRVKSERELLDLLRRQIKKIDERVRERSTQTRKQTEERFAQMTTTDWYGRNKETVMALLRPSWRYNEGKPTRRGYGPTEPVLVAAPVEPGGHPTAAYGLEYKWVNGVQGERFKPGDTISKEEAERMTDEMLDYTFQYMFRHSDAFRHSNPATQGALVELAAMTGGPEKFVSSGMPKLMKKWTDTKSADSSATFDSLFWDDAEGFKSMITGDKYTLRRNRILRNYHESPPGNQGDIKGGPTKTADWSAADKAIVDRMKEAGWMDDMGYMEARYGAGHAGPIMDKAIRARQLAESKTTKIQRFRSPDGRIIVKMAKWRGVPPEFYDTLDNTFVTVRGQLGSNPVKRAGRVRGLPASLTRGELPNIDLGPNIRVAGAYKPSNNTISMLEDLPPDIYARALQHEVAHSKNRAEVGTKLVVPTTSPSRPVQYYYGSSSNGELTRAMSSVKQFAFNKGLPGGTLLNSGDPEKVKNWFREQAEALSVGELFGASGKERESKTGMDMHAQGLIKRGADILYKKEHGGQLTEDESTIYENLFGEKNIWDQVVQVNKKDYGNVADDKGGKTTTAPKKAQGGK